MVAKLRKGQKKYRKWKMLILKNLAKTQDNNILRTISLPQETIWYPCFKPEIFSQAHKDPYTWNKNFQKI